MQPGVWQRNGALSAPTLFHWARFESRFGQRDIRGCIMAFRSIMGGVVAAILLAVSAGQAGAAPAYATQTANVRSGPGTNYRVVDVLRAGDPVDIQTCQGKWCLVRKAGPNGWVSSGLLRPASGQGLGPHIIIVPPGPGPRPLPPRPPRPAPNPCPYDWSCPEDPMPGPVPNPCPYPWSCPEEPMPEQ